MRTQKRRGERAAQREEEAIRRLPLIRYDAIEPVAVVVSRVHFTFLSICFFSSLLSLLVFLRNPLPPLSHETLFVPLFVAPLLDAKFQGRLGQ